MKRTRDLSIGLLILLVVLVCSKLPPLKAQNVSFHDAPASASKVKNPYSAQLHATEIGGQLYAVNCASYHGRQGEGAENIPALKSATVQAANEGELFWFITQGNVKNGMSSRVSLSESLRWPEGFIAQFPDGGSARSLSSAQASILWMWKRALRDSSARFFDRQKSEVVLMFACWDGRPTAQNATRNCWDIPASQATPPLAGAHSHVRDV